VTSPVPATGGTVRKRTVETVSLSTRTVEWHLSKGYTKLGVGSRRELRQALASLGQAHLRA
jgi:DNA-binding CsgD family transcriptional regulator